MPTCAHPGCQFRLIQVMTDSPFCFRHRPKPAAEPEPAPAPPQPAVRLPMAPSGAARRHAYKGSRSMPAEAPPAPPSAADAAMIHRKLGVEGRELFLRSVSADKFDFDPAAAARARGLLPSGRGRGRAPSAVAEEPAQPAPAPAPQPEELSDMWSSDEDGAESKAVDPRRPLDILYEEVLAALVPNAARRAQLVQSESDERKEQLIEMYQQYVSMAWVSVSVHDAIGLAKADRFGLSDPYCEVAWRASPREQWEPQGRTEVRRNTLHPTWGDRFRWKVPARLAGRGAVRVQCWDYNRIGAPDFLGEVVLSARQAKRAHASAKEYHDLLPREEAPGDAAFVQGAVSLTFSMVLRRED